MPGKRPPTGADLAARLARNTQRRRRRAPEPEAERAQQADTPPPAPPPLQAGAAAERLAPAFQACANTRAGTRAVQVRLPMGTYTDMDRQIKGANLKGGKLTIQEYLYRLVVGELHRPLSERARKRQVKPGLAAGANSRVAQVYLPYDVHAAFKQRAKHYRMNMQDLLHRLILSRIVRGRIPMAVKAPAAKESADA